jgi:hypothetical protein
MAEIRPDAARVDGGVRTLALEKETDCIAK